MQRIKKCEKERYIKDKTRTLSMKTAKPNNAKFVKNFREAFLTKYRKPVDKLFHSYQSPFQNTAKACHLLLRSLSAGRLTSIEVS